MRNNLMIGYPVRHKDVLETKNRSIFAVVELPSNGTNTILNITLKITPHLKLSKAINSIFSILNSWTSKKLRNTIYKPHRVQTIA